MFQHQYSEMFVTVLLAVQYVKANCVICVCVASMWLLWVNKTTYWWRRKRLKQIKVSVGHTNTKIWILLPSMVSFIQTKLWISTPPPKKFYLKCSIEDLSYFFFLIKRRVTQMYSLRFFCFCDKGAGLNKCLFIVFTWYVKCKIISYSLSYILHRV